MDDVAGFSIPASEHSTITAWGKDNELKAFENMLDKYPTGVVACVSDSYNIFEACSELWGEKLRDRILERDGRLVVRPDSGDPKTIDLKILEILGEKFGYETNSKGYKVLPPQIRIIQGDGIHYETVIEILEYLKQFGWSASNISFGSGGGLLQKLNRDTLKVAFKAALAVVDGKEIEVYKDPITAPGKKSKRGYMTVNRGEDGIIRTRTGADRDEKTDILETVFENGKLVKEYDWATVRDNAKITLDMILSKKKGSPSSTVRKCSTTSSQSFHRSVPADENESTKQQDSVDSKTKSSSTDEEELDMKSSSSEPSKGQVPCSS